ncbi:hypothetical protein JA1_000412 [Spathaspora sp. JA1]|nr:hypothetical protein JA1_000412 [Spathaspora sp. JA1]
MRQFLFLCYLLLLQILAAVNADETTLTWPPTFTYETEDCPTPTEWEDKCEYDLGERAQGYGYPDVITFEYKHISHIIGTNDLYEVLLEFEIDAAHQFPWALSLNEISFNDLQTPDDYLTSQKFAFDQDHSEELGDSPYHFFVKWVMQTEADGQSMCTTPFMIEYIWDAPAPANKAKRADVKAQYVHDCNEGDYPLQCWIPVCSGSETQSNDEETTSDIETSEVETSEIETSEEETSEIETSEEETSEEETSEEETSEEETSVEPTITAPPATFETTNESLPTPNTDCPTSWVDRCRVRPVQTGGFSPTMKNFEFIEINSIMDDYYEVLVEIEIDPSIFPASSLEYISLKDLVTPDDYLSNPFIIYDRSLTENVLGESPYHFFVRWAMQTQILSGLVCTTPFSIEFSWRDGTTPPRGRSSSSLKVSFIHDCDSEDPHDYPLQCWAPDCVGGEPSTITTLTNGVSEPTSCPTTFEADPGVCDFTFGSGSHSQSYPNLETFEFQTIQSVGDDYYEVMVEFAIDGVSLPKRKLQQIRVRGIESPNGYVDDPLVIYDRNSVDEVGDSPYHFFLYWIMQAQYLNGVTCTTPFSIQYIWDSESAIYGHGCESDNNGAHDYPLQCWSDECVEPEPVTIEPPKPNLPEPSNCPEAWTDNSDCNVNIGDNANLMGYPEVLVFEFQSIKFVDENLYEVVVEFQIDSGAHPKRDLKSVQISVDQSADGYLNDGLTIYDADLSENLAGDSPFHFYFIYITETEQFSSLTCTTPFSISYVWKDSSADYYHGCSSNDSPLQCWEEECYEEPEPSTIISTAEGKPPGYPCPTTFGPLECQIDVGTSSRDHDFPDVINFDFISVEWVEYDYFEVMIEFEIENTIPKRQLQYIHIRDLQPPDGYMTPIIELYNRNRSNNPVGDSPYHFFFKWLTKTEFFGDWFCTTPFRIEYQWDDDVVGEYGHGCPADSDMIDSPRQCWAELCEPETTGNPSTIISTDPLLPPATDCPSTYTDSCQIGPYEDSDTFNFVHIKVIQDNLYEVMLEVKLDTTRPRFGLYQIRAIGIPEEFSELYLYDHLGHSDVGDSPYHFFLVWAMEADSDGSKTCTVPFTIKYFWNDYYKELRHGCSDDNNYPIQCWDETCPEPEEPSTIITTRDDLPSPTACPIEFGPSRCPFEVGHSSKNNPFPDVLAFDFISIEWIEGESYEIMIEFEIENTIPKRELQSVSFSGLQTSGDYLSSNFELYNRNNLNNPVGDSPYHFFFKWVATTEFTFNMFCTTPFQIQYQWDYEFGDYGHGCYGQSNLLDSPLQCWEELCEPELTGEPSTITTITTDPDMPPPTECPSTYTDGCVAGYSEHPDFFNFVYIKSIEDNLYEVMLEVKLDTMQPKSSLRSILATGILGSNEVLFLYTYGEIDEVGDSPYHFFLVWVMEAVTDVSRTCTSPILFRYTWSNYYQEFKHSCYYSNEYPVQCWDDVCPEPLIESTTEPLIESTTEPEETTNEPEETTTEPEDPTTESGDPTTEPEEPTTEPEEPPTTEPEEPTTEPQEPTTEPQEQTTEPQEQTTESEESMTESQEPTEEPTTESEEYTTGPEEPTTDSEESTTGPNESTTEPEESTTEPEESTTEPEEPTTEPEEPTTEPEEPTTEPEEHTTELEDPTTGSEESTTESRESTGAPEESTSESEEPSSEPEESTSESEEPTTEPIKTTSEPGESTSEPGETSPSPEEPTTGQGDTTLPPTEPVTEEPISSATEPSTEDPTVPPTNEESTVTVTETAVEPPPPVTRTVTETITASDDSTTRVFTETVTYTTVDPPIETRTFTETTIRTDADPSTTRVFTDTVTYTTVDPPPGTRTLTDTVTTIIVDPGNPTNSITLTLTVTTTSVSPPPNPTGTPPNPPNPPPGTEITITISNPDTTYVTTVTEPYNPPVVVTTISNPDTTYITTITQPYNPPVVVTVSGPDTNYVTTVTQPFNPPLVVTVSGPDTTYVTTIAEPFNPPVVVTTISGVDTTYVTTVTYPTGFPSVPTGGQPGGNTPTDPNGPSNPNYPSGPYNPNVPVGTPEQEEELEVPYSGSDPNAPVNPNSPNGPYPNGPSNPNVPAGTPDQDEELQVPYSGGEETAPINPNDPNSPVNVPVGNPGQDEELQIPYFGGDPNAPGNPDAPISPLDSNEPAGNPGQDEELQVPYSGGIPASAYPNEVNSNDPNAVNPSDPNAVTPNYPVTNPDQKEELQVPASGGNSNDGTNPNVDAGNPNDPSLNPEGDELIQDPNALVYTSAVPTTFVSDGITYATSVPVVYTTSIPDGAPDVIVSPGSPAVGNGDDDLNADPNLEEMLEDFEGRASGLNSNAVLLFLGLISTILFV